MSTNFRSVLAKLKSERKDEELLDREQHETTAITSTEIDQAEISTVKHLADIPSELISASFEDDSIELYLFKSNEGESLGLQLNEFLVVVSVQNGSPAYHANVPARHRVVTVNQQLVSNLDDFGRVLSETTNPLEIHLRLAPSGQKPIFYPDLVDKVVVRMLTEGDFDLSIHRVNPRYEFLNETSPYHNVFRQRYDATTAAIEFLDRLVVSFKADKFSKSVQSTSYHACTGDEYDSGVRWLDAYIECRQTEENAKRCQYEAAIKKSKNLSSNEATEHALSNLPFDGSVFTICEAPMANAPDNAISLEEALRMSEEAFTTELPYDPFLFDPEEHSDTSDDEKSRKIAEDVE